LSNDYDVKVGVTGDANPGAIIQFSDAIENLTKNIAKLSASVKTGFSSLGNVASYHKAAGDAAEGHAHKVSLLQELYEKNSSTINRNYLSSIGGLKRAYRSLNDEFARTAISHKGQFKLMNESGLSMQRLAVKADLFGRYLDNSSKKMVNMGKNAQWTGRQLMVGVTAPLVAMGAKAVKIFSDMEKAEFRARKLIGDDWTLNLDTGKMEKSIDSLISKSKQLSVAWGSAYEEVITTAGEIKGVGFSTEDTKKLTEMAIAFDKISGINNLKSSQDFVRVIAQTSDGVGQAADKLAYFNAAEEKLSIDMGEITASFPKVANVFKQFNISIAEGIGILSSFKANGIDVSEGANAITSGISRLAQAAAGGGVRLKILTKFMKEFNDAHPDKKISFFDDQGKLLSGEKILYSLARASAVMNDKTQVLFEGLGFGTREYAKMVPVLKSVGEAYGMLTDSQGKTTQSYQDYQKAIQLGATSQDELNKKYKEQQDLYKNQPFVKFAGLVQEIRLAAQAIGNQLMPTAIKLLNIVKNLIDKFQALPDGTKKLITNFALLAAAIGPVTYGFAQLVILLGQTFRGVIAIPLSGLFKLHHRMYGFGEATESVTEALQKLYHEASAENLAGFTSALDNAKKKNVTFAQTLNATATAAKSQASELKAAEKVAETTELRRAKFAGILGAGASSVNATRVKTTVADAAAKAGLEIDEKNILKRILQGELGQRIGNASTVRRQGITSGSGRGDFSAELAALLGVRGSTASKMQSLFRKGSVTAERQAQDALNAKAGTMTKMMVEDLTRITKRAGVWDEMTVHVQDFFKIFKDLDSVDVNALVNFIAMTDNMGMSGQRLEPRLKQVAGADFAKMFGVGKAAPTGLGELSGRGEAFSAFQKVFNSQATKQGFATPITDSLLKTFREVMNIGVNDSEIKSVTKTIEKNSEEAGNNILNVLRSVEAAGHRTKEEVQLSSKEATKEWNRISKRLAGPRTSAKDFGKPGTVSPLSILGQLGMLETVRRDKEGVTPEMSELVAKFKSDLAKIGVGSGASRGGRLVGNKKARGKTEQQLTAEATKLYEKLYRDLAGLGAFAGADQLDAFKHAITGGTVEGQVKTSIANNFNKDEAELVAKNLGIEGPGKDKSNGATDRFKQRLFMASAAQGRGVFENMGIAVSQGSVAGNKGVMQYGLSKALESDITKAAPLPQHFWDMVAYRLWGAATTTDIEGILKDIEPNAQNRKKLNQAVAVVSEAVGKKLGMSNASLQGFVEDYVALEGNGGSGTRHIPRQVSRGALAKLSKPKRTEEASQFFRGHVGQEGAMWTAPTRDIAEKYAQEAAERYGVPDQKRIDSLVMKEGAKILNLGSLGERATINQIYELIAKQGLKLPPHGLGDMADIEGPVSQWLDSSGVRSMLGQNFDAVSFKDRIGGEHPQAHDTTLGLREGVFSPKNNLPAKSKISKITKASAMKALRSAGAGKTIDDIVGEFANMSPDVLNAVEEVVVNELGTSNKDEIAQIVAQHIGGGAGSQKQFTKLLGNLGDRMLQTVESEIEEFDRELSNSIGGPAIRKKKIISREITGTKLDEVLGLSGSDSIAYRMQEQGVKRSMMNLNQPDLGTDLTGPSGRRLKYLSPNEQRMLELYGGSKTTTTRVANDDFRFDQAQRGAGTLLDRKLAQKANQHGELGLENSELEQLVSHVNNIDMDEMDPVEAERLGRAGVALKEQRELLQQLEDSRKELAEETKTYFQRMIGPGFDHLNQELRDVEGMYQSQVAAVKKNTAKKLEGATTSKQKSRIKAAADKQLQGLKDERSTKVKDITARQSALTARLEKDPEFVALKERSSKLNKQQSKVQSFINALQHPDVKSAYAVPGTAGSAEDKAVKSMELEAKRKHALGEALKEVETEQKKIQQILDDESKAIPHARRRFLQQQNERLLQVVNDIKSTTDKDFNLEDTNQLRGKARRQAKNVAKINRQKAERLAEAANQQQYVDDETALHDRIGRNVTRYNKRAHLRQFLAGGSVQRKIDVANGGDLDFDRLQAVANLHEKSLIGGTQPGSLLGAPDLFGRRAINKEAKRVTGERLIREKIDSAKGDIIAGNYKPGTFTKKEMKKYGSLVTSELGNNAATEMSKAAKKVRIKPGTLKSISTSVIDNLSPAKIARGAGNYVKGGFGIKSAKKGVSALFGLGGGEAAAGMGSVIGTMLPILPLILAIAAGVILIVKNWSKVQKGLGDGLKHLKRAFGELLGAIVSPFKEMWSHITGDNENGTKKMGDLWKNVGKILNVVFHGLASTIHALALILTPVFQVIAIVIEAVVHYVAGLIDLFSGDGKGAMEQFGALTETVMNGIKLVFGNVLVFILRGLLLIPRTYLLAMSTLMNTLGKIKGPLGAPFRAVGNAIDKARDKVDDLEKAIDDKLTDRKSYNETSVVNIQNLQDVKKAVAAIKSEALKAGATEAQAKKVAQTYKDALESNLKKGMSMKAAQAAAYAAVKRIIDGYKKNIENSDSPQLPAPDTTDAEGAIEDSANKMKDALHSALMDTVSKWKDAALDAFDEYAKDQMDTFDKVAEATVKSIDDQIKAIDDLSKAEQEAQYQRDFLRKKDELAEQKQHNLLTFGRDRDKALYEGRVDDAKALQIDRDGQIKDENKQETDLDEEHADHMRDLDRDAQKQVLEQKKQDTQDLLKVQRDEKEKMLAIRKEALQAQLDEFAKFAPRTAEAARKLQADMLVALGSATDGYGKIGEMQAKRWAASYETAMQDAMKQMEDDQWWASAAAAGATPGEAQAANPAAGPTSTGASGGALINPVSSINPNNSVGAIQTDTDPNIFDINGDQLSGAQNVMAVQNMLANMGYDVGVIDGRMGPKTKAAIQAYNSEPWTVAAGEYINMDGSLTPKGFDTMLQEVQQGGTKFQGFYNWVKFILGSMGVQLNTAGAPTTSSGSGGTTHLVMHDGGMVGLKSDEVPAVLQKGEYVLKRSAVKAIGPGILNKLNDSASLMTAQRQGLIEGFVGKLQGINKFHIGGLVDAASAAGQSMTPSIKPSESADSAFNLNLHFDGGFFGSDREIEKLAATIEKRISPKFARAKGFEQRKINSI
jgi:hypothetical protein